MGASSTARGGWPAQTGLGAKLWRRGAVEIRHYWTAAVCDPRGCERGIYRRRRHHPGAGHASKRFAMYPLPRTGFEPKSQENLILRVIVPDMTDRIP
jgi:hypothetical protein